jgi:hypothetical protein
MKTKLFVLLIVVILLPSGLFSAELDDLFLKDTSFERRNGPLKTSVGAIWQMATLYFQTESSSTLPKGVLNIGFQLNLNNFFQQKQYTADGRYEIETDVETTVYSLEVNYGLLSWLTLGLRTQINHHGSGIMDPYIESFHRTVRSPNGGRETYPTNSISVFMYDTSTGKYVVNIRNSRPGIGDTVLKTHMRIFRTENKMFGIGAKLALKIPTGKSTSLMGSGSFDFGAGILLDFAPFRWVVLYFNTYYTLNGDYKGLDNVKIPLSDRWQVSGAVEFIITGKSSLIFQGTWFKSPWQSIYLDRINGTGIQGYAGFKYRISRNFTFQFYIMEDFNPWTTSDITFSFGFYFYM